MTTTIPDGLVGRLRALAGGHLMLGHTDERMLLEEAAAALSSTQSELVETKKELTHLQRMVRSHLGDLDATARRNVEAEAENERLRAELASVKRRPPASEPKQ